MTTIDIESTNGHTTRKSRIDDGDSLSGRLKSLRIEALARKKELESQKAAIEKELSEIDETFGFSGETEVEKPKTARKPRAKAVEVAEGLEATALDVIFERRTKGISLADLADAVDAPKEVVTKILKSAISAGKVKAVGAARARKYHPAAD
jgi:hypothetical protein